MVLLSFDIEEFDTPLEFQKNIPFEEQLSVSRQGTVAILSLLHKRGVKATFYCTANFAVNCPDLIHKIVEEGHELASHGYYHSSFKLEHLATSKQKLEEIAGVVVNGYRMARMMPVDEMEIEKAGYKYNSSINPTWLPGRYNNRHISRTWFYQGTVLQLPASVTPCLRIPLFWLSFHNFPKILYRWLSFRTYKKDGYLNIYFHPWEFTPLGPKEKYNFPMYIRRNTGEDMVNRLDQWIATAQKRGLQFATTRSFIASLNK